MVDPSMMLDWLGVSHVDLYNEQRTIIKMVMYVMRIGDRIPRVHNNTSATNARRDGVLIRNASDADADADASLTRRIISQRRRTTHTMRTSSAIVFPKTSPTSERNVSEMLR